MCYYDNFKYQCNDWKWGNFRQHCQKEYRTGETCGIKMIYQTLALHEKCNLCEKIERKQRRLAKHRSDYTRWAQDPSRYRASMEKALAESEELKQEITALMAEKQARYMQVGNMRRPLPN